MAKPAVIYVSYDGMLEPLGQSQVLAYLERLAQDYAITLISFERAADRRDTPRMDAMRARLQATGIEWRTLKYHKSPTVPATLFDMTCGTAVALWFALRRRARILHGRSDLPSVMLLPAKWLTGARLLFDVRGFWADERVDGGLWAKGGRIYKTVRWLEDILYRNADHVVTLTNAAAAEMTRFPVLQDRRPPITVIPTCADLDRFTPPTAPPTGPLTVGYIGSVGTWYMFDECLAFFKAVRLHRPDARLLVVNRNDHAFIRAALDSAGIDPALIELRAANPNDMPALVQQMHVGLCLIKPCYSKISSAPTKLAEYLGCGVPVLGNAGVGDMHAIITDRRVGVSLTEFAPSAIEHAAARMLELAQAPDMAQRCAAASRSLFSLDIGVKRYGEAYRAMLSSRHADDDFPAPVLLDTVAS